MKDLKVQMLEKYLHSRGAALLGEGRIDQAIACFEQAVALADHSYTRCDLSFALRLKGNLSEAIKQMNRAIVLDPYTARYYYERSGLHKMGGDESGARADRERAIDVDSNYLRMEKIHDALGALEEFSAPQRVARASCYEHVEDSGLAAAIMGIRKSYRLSTDNSLEMVSCSLNCPAFCCYFEGNPLLHGLSIGPWKLSKVREMLRCKGLNENDYLERTELNGDDELDALVRPDHLVREQGRRYVYSPKAGGAPLDVGLVPSKPKGRDYRDLVWISAKSWSCSFLYDHTCMIHDVGDDPALPACKEFFCLTGFVFALLAKWDLVDMEEVVGKAMVHLNQVAVDAALIVSEQLIQAEDVKMLKRSIEALTAEAVEVDALKNASLVAGMIGRIREQTEGLDKLFATRKVTAKRLIAEALRDGCR